MGNFGSMGMGSFSSVNNNDMGDNSADAVFVIPRHINFTPIQMASMIELGQQPGVPFRVGDEGAQRPSRPTKKAHITNSLSCINKRSFHVTINDNGIFSVQFQYDSLVPVALFIYFGAKDTNSVDEIRPKRISHSWGPFDLPAGQRASWSSKNEFVNGNIQDLSCSYESDKTNGHGLHYDFIVILDSAKTAKKRDNSTAVVQASYFTVDSSCFKSTRDSGGLENNPSASLQEGEWNRLQQQPSNKTRGSHSLQGVTGSTSVTCRQQKVQILGGEVYVVQDLYGMAAAQNITAEESSQISPENELDSDLTPPPDATDEDTSECVICLTDEKEVVVYPCRHMCMCITCAEALPSQGNKCPMCRRPASMLLRLKSTPNP